MQEQGLSHGELNRPVPVFSTYSVHNITMSIYLWLWDMGFSQRGILSLWCSAIWQNPEGCNLKSHCYETLKTHTIMLLCGASLNSVCTFKCLQLKQPSCYNLYFLSRCTDYTHLWNYMISHSRRLISIVRSDISLIFLNWI